MGRRKKKRKNHKKVPIFCIFKIAEKIQKIIVFWWFFLFENNLRNAGASLCKRIKVYSKNASFWLFEKLLFLINCRIFDHPFMLLHRLAPGFPILIWTTKNHQQNYHFLYFQKFRKNAKHNSFFMIFFCSTCWDICVKNGSFQTGGVVFRQKQQKMGTKSNLQKKLLGVSS